VAAAIAAVLLTAGPAGAARPQLPNEQTLGNDRFLIHWAGPPAPDGSALARAALLWLPLIQDRTEADLGFPLRLDDTRAGLRALGHAYVDPGYNAADPTGDPRYDVYIRPLADAGGRNVTGRNLGSYMEIDSELPADHCAYVLAHEYFHTAQFLVDPWGHTGWLVEATANWAADRVTVPFASFSNTTAGAFSDEAWRRPEVGYEWAAFVEYLVSRFGISVVHELLETAADLAANAHGPDPRADPGYPRRIVDQVLQRQGSSAAAALRGYAANVAFPRFGYMSRLEPTDYFKDGSAWLVDVPRSERRPQTRHLSFALGPWELRMLNIRPRDTRGFQLAVGGAGGAAIELQNAADLHGSRLRRIAPRDCGGAVCFVVAPGASGYFRLVVAAADGDDRRIGVSATPLRAGTRAKRPGSSARRRG
jgi:hypothetical protein